MNQQHLFSHTSIVLAGAAITFSLFVFMAQLIKSDHVFQTSPTPIPDFELFFKPPAEPKATEKDRIKPKPVPPTISRIAPPSAPTGDEVFQTDFTPPTIPEVGNDYSRGQIDSEALPVVQVAPQYPITAARNGKEGFVVVMFDITEAGTVTNAQVIQAEPKRMFNRAAIQAINNWKYKPKVVTGQAIKQLGVQVRLDFTLDQTR